MSFRWQSSKRKNAALKGRPVGSIERLESRELLAVVINGPFSGVEGQPITTVANPASSNIAVATFSPNTPNDVTGSQTSDFFATILWGDGSTSTGLIQPVTATSYQVIGSHAYAVDQTYSINVQVSGTNNSTAVATTPGTATVVDAPLISTGTNITESTAPFNAIVANFRDTNPFASTAPGQYTATINWGDATPPVLTQGIISPDGQGGYNVIGSHTYAKSGTYSTIITIQEADGGAQTTASVL